MAEDNQENNEVVSEHDEARAKALRQFEQKYGRFPKTPQELDEAIAKNFEPEPVEETQDDPVQTAKMEVLDMMKKTITIDSQLSDILTKAPNFKQIFMKYFAAIQFVLKGYGGANHFVLNAVNDGQKITFNFEFFDKNNEPVYPEQFTKIMKGE